MSILSYFSSCLRPRGSNTSRSVSHGVDDPHGPEKCDACDIVTRVPIEQVLVDPERCPRHCVDQERVKEFAAGLDEDSYALPPIDVAPDGGHHVLADGGHRLDAHRCLGLPEIAIGLHPVLEGWRRRESILVHFSSFLHPLGSNASRCISRYRTRAETIGPPFEQTVHRACIATDAHSTSSHGHSGPTGGERS